jgi:hypothetical protein
MDENTTAPAAEATTQKSTPFSLPDSWPGGFGAYKYSRDVVRTNMGTVAGLIVLSLVVSLLFGGRSTSHPNGLSIISDLVNVWVNAALVITFLAGIKSTKIDFVDSLKQGGSLFLKFLGLSILSSIILIVSFLALIVPFFFVMPRIILAPYFMVDRNLGPIEALKASWNETKDHSGKVWGIVGAALVMAILVIVLIGIYFLIMYSAVLAVLYAYLQKNKSSEAPVAVAAPVPEAPAAPVA